MNTTAIERRRMPRLKLRNSRTKVLVYGKPIGPYPVLDICAEGLAFRYSSPGVWAEKHCVLDIVDKGEMLLERVEARVAADCILSAEGFSCWRRGVHFPTLSDEQRRRLAAFLASLG
ncbi:MAG: hypothetical protein AB1568_08340 [Thermodesulfobacteriota bacterium]